VLSHQQPDATPIAHARLQQASLCTFFLSRLHQQKIQVWNGVCFNFSCGITSCGYTAVKEDPRANSWPVNAACLQQLTWDWSGTAPGRFSPRPVVGAGQMAPTPIALSCPSVPHPAAPLQSRRDVTTNSAAADRHYADARVQSCSNNDRLLTGAVKLKQNCIEDILSCLNVSGNTEVFITVITRHAVKPLTALFYTRKHRKFQQATQNMGTLTFMSSFSSGSSLSTLSTWRGTLVPPCFRMLLSTFSIRCFSVVTLTFSI